MYCRDQRARLTSTGIVVFVGVELAPVFADLVHAGSGDCFLLGAPLHHTSPNYHFVQIIIITTTVAVLLHDCFPTCDGVTCPSLLFFDNFSVKIPRDHMVPRV